MSSSVSNEGCYISTLPPTLLVGTSWSMLCIAPQNILKHDWAPAVKINNLFLHAVFLHQQEWVRQSQFPEISSKVNFQHLNPYLLSKCLQNSSENISWEELHCLSKLLFLHRLWARILTNYMKFIDQLLELLPDWTKSEESITIATLVLLPLCTYLPQIDLKSNKFQILFSPSL